MYEETKDGTGWARKGDESKQKRLGVGFEGRRRETSLWSEDVPWSNRLDGQKQKMACGQKPRNSQTISIPSKVSVARKRESHGKEHRMDIEWTNSTHTMKFLVSEMTRYL